MPACAVPTCKNNAGLKKKKDGITFHTFPADEEEKWKWTKVLQRARLDEYWKPSNRSVICSIHFDEKHFYETKCGYKRLKKGVVPNKNIATATEEPQSSTNIHASENAKLLSSPQGNSEIGDVDISDSDFIFDTPKEAKLRSQLRRLQILTKKHVRRIKTLQQQKIRLVKRNESLKNIVRNLKQSLSGLPGRPTKKPDRPASLAGHLGKKSGHPKLS